MNQLKVYLLAAAFLVCAVLIFAVFRIVIKDAFDDKEEDKDE